MVKVKTQEIPLKTAAEKVSIKREWGQLAELRIRAGRSAVAIGIDGKMHPCSDLFTAEDVAECFRELCRYSIHSYENEIAEGYITVNGGNRVGIAGTAVMNGTTACGMRDISSLNIRLAHEVKGCAEHIYRTFFADGLRSLLLVGRPMSGKTTVLRDLSRILGAEHRVTLIDSRNEISSSVDGTPSFDVGINTDVLCGYPKSIGILHALRSLSPEIVLCDEIGDDHSAIRECMFCGVKLVATAHGASLDEVSRRYGVSELLPMFDVVAVLGEKGTLKEVQM